MKTKERDLKDLIGHSRVKRGWINALGSVFKTITGNLDNSDAEYYNEAIDNINTNEKELTQLIKAQVQVVQTTITNFNETITNLHKNEKIFNENIKAIETYTKLFETRVYNLEVKENINQHLTFLTLMCNELNNELSTLITAVLFAKQHTLHPKIISPIQYIDELQKTIKYVPTGLHYPYRLDYSFAHELLNLVTLQVFYMNNRLIYVISNPLISETTYHLYALIPLPILQNDKTYLFIQPSTKYLAMSTTKIQYTTLDDLSHCKITSENTYICKMTKPIFTSHVKSICETELLFSNERIPETCDTRIIQITNEIWHKLLNKNEWAFVLPKKSDVTITCDKNPQPRNTIISGTGIFHLSPHCKAYTPSAILIAESSFESNYSSITPSFNISNDDCCIKHTPNISNLPTFKQIPVTNINLDNLEVASNKLNTISKMADEILKNKDLHRRISIFTYIGYAVCICIVVYLIILLIRCCRKTKNPNHTHTHDEENACTKIVNCLTFNVRNSQRPQTDSNNVAETIKLSKHVRRRSVTPKPIPEISDDPSESEEEIDTYPQPEPRSFQRQPSILKDKY